MVMDQLSESNEFLFFFFTVRHLIASSPTGPGYLLENTQRYFEALAPYFDRDCFRSFTAPQSRAPRTM